MKAKGKSRRALRTVLFLFIGVPFFFILSTASQTEAQKPAPTPPPGTTSPDKNSSSDNDGPLTTFEEEIRAKRAIKQAEKEYQANLARAREVSQLGRELQESVKKKNTLDHDDNKKVERLEKLTKRLRGDAGGGDNEVKMDTRPVDLASTVGRIVEVTENLSKNVENTPRQVVSMTVIDNANVLLELIRMMRTFSR